MRTKLILIVALTSMALFSSFAMAGGDHCDSFKGHKDMSAKDWKEFKDNHAWMFSHGEHDVDNSAPKSDKPNKQDPHQDTSDLVEI